MYFKLDESLAHSSLKFSFGISRATAKVYLNFVGHQVNEMHV